MSTTNPRLTPEQEGLARIAITIVAGASPTRTVTIDNGEQVINLSAGAAVKELATTDCDVLRPHQGEGFIQLVWCNHDLADILGDYDPRLSNIDELEQYLQLGV